MLQSLRNLKIILILSVSASILILLCFSSNSISEQLRTQAVYENICDPKPTLVGASRIRDNYGSLLLSAPISKDVIIHRVYYDDRKRYDDLHVNRTVFFVNVKWYVFLADLIIGCGVNNQRALEYQVRLPAQWWEDRKFGKYVYEHMIVFCYDLPVKTGDRAFLIYKVHECSPSYIVESEYPVIKPGPRVPSNDSYNFTVLACIKANTKTSPFLGELLRYQKAIGIDHISLIALSIYIKDGGLTKLLREHPIIHQYILQGYIKIDVWKQWYQEKDIRNFAESIRKVSCMYHHRGTYDYGIPIDTDDFFTPCVSGESNIKYYINRFCHEYPIGSCTLKWIYYFPEFCGLKSIPENGNVTKALKSYTNEVQPSNARKSIHKIQALLDATYHDALRPINIRIIHDLMPGFEVKDVNSSFAYFAHNRINANPKSKKCK